MYSIPSYLVRVVIKIEQERHPEPYGFWITAKAIALCVTIHFFLTTVITKIAPRSLSPSLLYTKDVVLLTCMVWTITQVLNAIACSQRPQREGKHYYRREAAPPPGAMQ